MEYKTSVAYVKDVYEYFKLRRDCTILVPKGMVGEVGVIFNNCVFDDLGGLVHLEFLYNGEVIVIEVYPTKDTSDLDEPLIVIGGYGKVHPKRFSMCLVDELSKRIQAVGKVTLNIDFNWL